MDEKAQDALEPAPTDSFPLTVTDGLDRQVTFSRAPRRIVSLGPKNTELLFAIGAGDRVVGVTRYCNHPPQARQRTPVGGFGSASLSLEKIVALQPDLVVSVGTLHEPVIADLQRLGISVLALAAESFGGLCEELNLLGQVTGHEQQAALLVQEIRERIARVRTVARQVPQDQRVRVLYRVWDDPLKAAGPESYIGEMIELCGAVNIIDEPARYLQISEEVILQRNPDVILVPSGNRMALSADPFQNKPAWKAVSAVRGDRIYQIEDDLISRCGPRLIDALDAMAAMLYPRHFGEQRAGAVPSEQNRPEAAQL